MNGWLVFFMNAFMIVKLSGACGEIMGKAGKGIKKTHSLGCYRLWD